MSAAIVQPLAPLFGASIMQSNDLRNSDSACNSRRLHLKPAGKLLSVDFLLALASNVYAKAVETRAAWASALSDRAAWVLWVATVEIGPEGGSR